MRKTLLAGIFVLFSCTNASAITLDDVYNIAEKYEISEHKHVLAAIASVESCFGGFRGTSSIYNYFRGNVTEYTKRTQVFRNENPDISSRESKELRELEALLRFNRLQIQALENIAKETGRNVKDFKGSFAGAMGFMQFQPATWELHKQDGDKDGIRDPLNDLDAVASTANFLKKQLENGDIENAILEYNCRSQRYLRKVQKEVERYRKEEEMREYSKSIACFEAGY